jgi:16S rRNA processing protein RimM
MPGIPDQAGDPASSELIAVGRIGPAHGNRGDVFVEPWTDLPEVRFAPGAVLRTQPESVGPLSVETWRMHGGKLVLHFHGVDDRDAVIALRATLLMVPAGARPPLEDPDDFYDSDLVGLVAVTTQGAEVGRVQEVVHLGIADYLLVKVAGVDRLVPFVRAIVPEVDIAGGRVVIDPPEGLFEL